MRCRSLILVLLLAVPASWASAHPGHGIVIDSKDAIHFVDLAHGSIWTISPDGRLRQTEVGRHMHTLAIDAADNLYFEHIEFIGPPVTVGDPPWVEETGTRIGSLWMLDPAGNLSPVVPPTPTTYRTRSRPVIDDFGNGLTVVRDAQGASYGVVYTDEEPFPSLVRRTPGTPAGTTTTVIPRLFERREGAEHPVAFGVFQAFTWGRNGSILATERGTIRRINPDGSVIAVGGAPLRSDPTIGTSPVLQDSILGVAEDNDGNVYAADYGQACVRKIDPGDQVTTVYRAPFGWSPTGVAVSGEDVYILENRVDIISPFLSILGVRGGLGGPRVLRLAPDGTVTVLATVHAQRIRYFQLALVAGVVLIITLIWRRVRRRAARAADLHAE